MNLRLLLAVLLLLIGSGALAAADAKPGKKPAPAPTNPYFDDPSGVVWEVVYERALAQATQQKRPVVVLMTRANCPNSFFLCKDVLAVPALRARLQDDFVPLLLPIETDADKPPPGINAKGLERIRALKQAAIATATRSSPGAFPPFLLMLGLDGSVIASATGLLDQAAMTAFLDADPRPKPKPKAKKR